MKDEPNASNIVRVGRFDLERLGRRMVIVTDRSTGEKIQAKFNEWRELLDKLLTLEPQRRKTGGA